jgi:hypothetical protein
MQQTVGCLVHICGDSPQRPIDKRENSNKTTTSVAARLETTRRRDRHLVDAVVSRRVMADQYWMTTRRDSAYVQCKPLRDLCANQVWDGRCDDVELDQYIIV